MSNEFMASLVDSEKAFIGAIIQEERHGFEFEDTLTRKYEEGFIDGMRHAYALLTSASVERPDTHDIEKATREACDVGDWKSVCPHEKYSESVFSCSQHGDEAPCHERNCDNCDEVMLHVQEADN